MIECQKELEEMEQKIKSYKLSLQSETKKILEALHNTSAKIKEMRCKECLEKDKKIEEMQRTIDLLKKQFEDLKNKGLTEKPKPKPKVVAKTVAYDSFVSTDESEKDDDKNDPDYTKTPLYIRSKINVKQSSNESIKCECKTFCSSLRCKCKKNEVACENCTCNPDRCKNRNTDNVHQY